VKVKAESSVTTEITERHRETPEAQSVSASGVFFAVR